MSGEKDDPFSGSVSTRLADPVSGRGPRRVLFLAPQPFYEDRGTPIATRHILEALSGQGVAVDLITFPVGEPVALPGLRIFRVGRGLPIRTVPIGLSRRKLLLDALLSFAAVRRLLRERYDCIHAVEEAAFPAAVAGRALGVPVLYDMASSLPEQLAERRGLSNRGAQRLLRGFERWLLRRVDRIVCSAGLASRVLDSPGAAPVVEWVFPSAEPRVSADEIVRLRESLTIPEDALVAVYTGSFAPYQAIDLLLDAASQVHARRPDVVFVLVGAPDGDEGTNDGTRPWLRLVPRQPRREIDRYLAMADILVSTRRAGGNLPSKVFDYLSAGKPIVATDCVAHRAVLDTDRAQLVPLDARAIAEAVLLLVQRPELRRQLGQAGHAYARAHLSRAAFSEFVGRMYRDCMRHGLSDAASERSGSSHGG